MSIGRILRAIILGVVLSGGSVLGVPMRPEEIEELMSRMNKPNVEVIVDQSEVEDHLSGATFRAE
jgi:hypothetical protein